MIINNETIIGVIQSSSQKKSTLNEVIKSSMRLKVSRVSFSDYDFIRLFLAYLRKNGEVFFDGESLGKNLYSYILGGYEELFQDIAVKKQIEGNNLEIQEALQNASFYGLITAHDCGPNDARRLILINEEESNSIIEKYDENICSKMEDLVKDYLKHRYMRKMIAADFREDEEIVSEESDVPIRSLRRTEEERRQHLKDMIRKDFEEDE